MKTRSKIFLMLALLGFAMPAFAFYNPSTGRWLSRDSIEERGFQVIANRQQTDGSLPAKNRLEVLRRFIDSESLKIVRSQFGTEAIYAPKPDQNTIDLYLFSGNAPVLMVDPLGLDPCGSAAPVLASSCVCDKYGNELYSNDPGLQVGLKCFCKCAGDSPWSQAVRGCLACEHAKGTDITWAHAYCYYKASLSHIMPVSTLQRCFTQCGGDWGKFINSLPPILIM